MSEISLVGQIHFAIGSLSLLAGCAAFLLPKGRPAHVAAGRGFAISMLLLCASGLYMSITREIVFTVFLSLFAAHAVTTGWLAAVRRSGQMGMPERALALLIAGVGLASLVTGMWVMNTASGELDGLPPVGFFSLGGVAILIAMIDLQALVRRTVSPKHRIARHLWRMGFSMFIATFIFFFGNNHVLPEVLRADIWLVVPVAVVVLSTVVAMAGVYGAGFATRSGRF